MLTIIDNYTGTKQGANCAVKYVGNRIITNSEVLVEANGAQLLCIFRNHIVHHYEIHFDGEYFHSYADERTARAMFKDLTC